MARGRRKREVDVLNNTSFLDVMANMVGALTFILVAMVIVTIALKLNYLDLHIETEKLPDAIVGEQYNVILAGTGGNEPYRWRLLKESQMPKGLNFIVMEQAVLDQYGRPSKNPGGKILGVPREATAGPVRLTFELDDTPVINEETKKIVADRTPVTKSFSLNIKSIDHLRCYAASALSIDTYKLPSAMVNRPYDLTLAASGGLLPYRWMIAGTLPPGLRLDGNRIVGTPEQRVPSKQFRVTVESEVGCPRIGKDSKTLTMVVDPEPGKRERFTIF